MAKDRSIHEKYTVAHSNWLKPEDYLRFIHFDNFTSDWNEQELTDDDLRILQIQIMLSPTAGPVIAGTGGSRKLRFSPPSWNRGKSGSLRVLYAVFPDHSVAALAAAYSKNQKENISGADKRLLKALLKNIDETLKRERKPS